MVAGVHSNKPAPFAHALGFREAQIRIEVTAGERAKTSLRDLIQRLRETVLNFMALTHDRLTKQTAHRHGSNRN